MWIDCFVGLLFMQLTIGPSVLAGESELEKCAKVTEDELYPRCTLSMENNNGSVKAQCLDGGEVLRIVGDYRAFRIICLSYFRLEFTYDGTHTPNAVGTRQVRYFEGGLIKEYEIRARIWSVSKLEENFAARWAEHPPVAQNSRTGRFNFFGTGNFRDFSKSFYIFFEEPGQEPKLIKSKHTDHASYEPGYVCARVPCRSTHYKSMPTIEISQSNKLVTQSKTSGFRICGLTKAENFKCHLQYNGRTDNWEIRETNDTNGAGPRYEYFLSESAQGQKTSKPEQLLTFRSFKS